jgi:hypothetical protein
MSAQPIWHSAPASACIYIKQYVNLTKELGPAWIECAGTGPLQLYVNGELALRSAGPALTTAVMWQRVDMGKLLRQGENSILVWINNGPDANRPPWFMAQGEITYADGSQLELATGSPWQVLPATSRQDFDEPPLSAVYFAAEQAVHWNTGAFRAEDWQDAAVVAVPSCQPLSWNPPSTIEEEIWAQAIVEFGEINAAGPLEFVDGAGAIQQSKCVRREAVLQKGRSQALVQTRDVQRAVYLVLDFGRQVTGFPCLRMRSRGGNVIDMGFAHQVGQIDGGLRYVSKQGWQEWTGLQMQSCRYIVLRLSHCEEELEFDSVSVVERRVEMPQEGRFMATDALEQIWQTGVRSLRSGRQEIYFLGSGQESYDWLRAYALALNDYYLSGDTQTAGATLASKGAAVSTATTAPQLLACALFLEAYYLYSGDQSQVDGLLPRLGELIGGFAASGAEALQEAVDATWSYTALHALYAGALLALGRLCRVCKQQQAAVGYEQSAARVQRDLQGAWSAERGVFLDQADGEPASQWANALILYFELATEEQKREIAQHIGDSGVEPVQDLLQAFFLVGGLFRTDIPEHAVDQLERHWGRLLVRPGTVWNEKEKKEQLEQVSPGPEYYLGSQVLGLVPSSPGAKVLEIRPQRAALAKANGRVYTASGWVDIAWDFRKEGPYGFIRLELEEDGQIHLFVPRLGLRFPTVTLNGETLWSNEKVYPNSFVQEILSTDECVVPLLRRGGVYEIEVQ